MAHLDAGSLCRLERFISSDVGERFLPALAFDSMTQREYDEWLKFPFLEPVAYPQWEEVA